MSWQPARWYTCLNAIQCHGSATVLPWCDHDFTSLSNRPNQMHAISLSSRAQRAPVTARLAVMSKHQGGGGGGGQGWKGDGRGGGHWKKVLIDVGLCTSCLRVWRFVTCAKQLSSTITADVHRVAVSNLLSAVWAERHICLHQVHESCGSGSRGRGVASLTAGTC